MEKIISAGGVKTISQLEYEEQLRKDFQEKVVNAEGLIPIALTPLQAWSVIENIQLACRHPKNQGNSAALAAEVAKVLQEILSVTPTLAKAIRAGWAQTPQAAKEIKSEPTIWKPGH